MAQQHLSAVVDKQRTQAAIAALRSEGVYDDGRSIYECGDALVAIPVTSYPVHTDVIEVIREEGEPRLRTLEDHLRERGWTDDELDQAPASWAVVGSVILVDVGDAPRQEEVGEALLALHGEADTVLARQGIAGPHREPDVEFLVGEGDTETVHVEHGTTYAMDLAKVMFSPGNKAERARMGEVVRGGERSVSPDRANGESEAQSASEASGGAVSDERPASQPEERVLDAFAGIGYFTLPMARAGAAVTAVERNPDAFEYLLENAMRNGVQDRVQAYRGDNREVVPELVDDGISFDRICMGHYDSWEYLDALLPALEPGGMVHMHEATPESLVPERPVGRLEDAAAELGRSVEVADVRTVKTHSEGVAHVVVDARVE